MKMKIVNAWYRLRSSFWFVPTLMVVLSICLAYATNSLDVVLYKKNLFAGWWTYTGGVEGAHAVLSTIAGSMVTVAGVIFSITIVVLSLTSSQYGPRLIRNFMEDRGNQIVLGMFVSAFVFCLMVLRQSAEVDNRAIVPQLSVFVGFLLAMAGLGMLIYFIHHISSSIQANNLLAKIGRELNEAISRLFPENLGKGEWDVQETQPANLIPEDFEIRAVPIASSGIGYLQMIDIEKLMDVAVQNDLIVQLEYRPGHFILEGNPLVKVWSSDTLEEELTELTGVMNDASVRALSPGINDPFTAITSIDWIGSGLAKLCERRMTSQYRYDKEDNLRVITLPVSLDSMIDCAFNQIRQNGISHPAVSIRMLETIAAIAPHVRRENDRNSLLRHAEMIHRGAIEFTDEEEDQKDIHDRYQKAKEALSAHGNGPSLTNAPDKE